MVVEGCRSQQIPRKVKVKPNGLGESSRRNRLEHGCRQNRDVRLDGLISQESRSGQQLKNNHEVEGLVVVEKSRNGFESQEVHSRRDHRGNSALWIRNKITLGPGEEQSSDKDDASYSRAANASSGAPPRMGDSAGNSVDLFGRQ
jgi:hypothetical protein